MYVHLVFFLFANFIVTDFKSIFRHSAAPQSAKRAQPNIKTEDDTAGEQ